MKRFLLVIFAGLVLKQPTIAQHVHSENSGAKEEDYYRIVTLPIPNNIGLEVGGLVTLPDDRLAVSTRLGEVWLIANPYMLNNTQPLFKRFAYGLHEPLGLAYYKNAFYAPQRGELTRITDLNGDDSADKFETVCTWPLSGNYCEYNHGPVIDKEGNFYLNFNLGDNGWYTREAFYGEMGSHAAWRGWMMKITPEGKLIPYATGLRSPAGIGTNAQGEIFYSENQGGWVGTGYITPVKQGDFFGHPSGLKSTGLPGSPVKIKPSDIPTNDPLLHQAVAQIPGFRMPAVRFPHGIMGVSTSSIIADTVKGKFGPFEGQLFVGDEGHSKIMRVCLEKVKGEYQGAVFAFREGFISGILRSSWGSDGSLFVGMSDRGWNSTGPERFGLQRLVWTGKTPFEIKTIHAEPDGFELEFTLPVDPATAKDPRSYQISGFTYSYHQTYGSDVMDRKPGVIKGVIISPDHKKVRLVIDGLREGYIHEINGTGIRSANGGPLLHNVGYYSLNRLPEGQPADLKPGEIITTSAVPNNKTGQQAASLIDGKTGPANLTVMPASWKGIADYSIAIGSKPGLKFNPDLFEVKAGARVSLTFTNNDDMQHNLVIVLPGTADEVGKQALGLGLDGPALNYIPKSDKVLYHTRLLQPRSSETIYFTAPSKPGKYTYVCTYPGHYLVMRGTLIVTAK